MLVRVDQELATRGHEITLLVSSEEGLNRQELGKRAFAGLDILTFQGPVGIGTKEWFANQPPDVTEVAVIESKNQLQYVYEPTHMCVYVYIHKRINTYIQGAHSNSAALCMHVVHVRQIYSMSLGQAACITDTL